MYAIIVTGGKQYRVEQGDIVYIEKLDVEADYFIIIIHVLKSTHHAAIIKLYLEYLFDIR